MYQFKIRKTKRTTGERNEEANQNEESPPQIQIRLGLSHLMAEISIDDNQTDSIQI